MQAAVKGSYTPLADTLKQVDSITKDEVVKVIICEYPLGSSYSSVSKDGQYIIIQLHKHTIGFHN